MKSYRSIDEPLKFQDGHTSMDLRYSIFVSNKSVDNIITFKERHTSTDLRNNISS